MLLNESFSTTSFEEGYYIPRDAVRAMLKRAAAASTIRICTSWRMD